MGECFYQNAQCVIVKNQRVLTENLNNAKGFEHLFSIARRVGKVDDLVTDLDFQLRQIKQIL